MYINVGFHRKPHTAIECVRFIASVSRDEEGAHLSAARWTGNEQEKTSVYYYSPAGGLVGRAVDLECVARHAAHWGFARLLPPLSPTEQAPSLLRHVVLIDPLHLRAAALARHAADAALAA